MRLWLLMVAIALGALSARAQLIDVNFYSAFYLGSAASGAAATGAAGDIWNGINDDNVAGGPIYNLVDTTGTATPVSLSYNTDSTPSYGAVTSIIKNTQPNPVLMNNYLFNNTHGDITVTLQGLSDSTLYNLWLYVASCDAIGSDRAADLTANSVFASATGTPEGNFDAGQNYVLIQTTSSASGTINITESDDSANTSGEVDLNGLQISSVPDLATTLPLLTISGLGLILFARRTSKDMQAGGSVQ